MEFFAIRRRDSNEWLNVSWSKGPLTWGPSPKLFVSASEANKTLSSWKGQMRRWRYSREELLGYEHDIEIVRVRLEVL